jgi:hypothetical protein
MMSWMLDKRIPLSVLLAICVQAVAVLVWAAQLDGRVFTLEKQLGTTVQMQEKVGRIEERLQGVKEDVQSIRHSVEQLTQFLMRDK